MPVRGGPLTVVRGSDVVVEADAGVKAVRDGPLTVVRGSDLLVAVLTCWSRRALERAWPDCAGQCQFGMSGLAVAPFASFQLPKRSLT